MDEKEIVLLWDRDKSTPFDRYLTNCGFDCEVVTPNVLVAPFWPKERYYLHTKLIIVQAGFGNELYSKILKELRANSVNIMQFVRRGGTLLVFGAYSNKNAYNWLPLSINYVIEERIVKIGVVKEHEAATIVDKEKEQCFCDGYFAEIGEEGEIILTGNGNAILGVAEYEAGQIIATAIHEYPSPKFIEYCIG